MTIEDRIKDEKLQYEINREAAKISALSSGKLDKYEYVTGEEILPSNQQQIIQQAKFDYSPLGKAIEKQIKTIKDQGEKQVVALESLNVPNKKLSSIKDFMQKQQEVCGNIVKIYQLEMLIMKLLFFQRTILLIHLSLKQKSQAKLEIMERKMLK